MLKGLASSGRLAVLRQLKDRPSVKVIKVLANACLAAGHLLELCERTPF